MTVAAAIMLLIAAALVLLRGGWYLTLRDKNGRLMAQYPLEEGGRFSVTFIHSVNQYPLTDTFEICDRTIFVEECEYCAFGAGVQTELNPGETLEYVDIDKFGYKGRAMLIRNIHQDRTNVGYFVGTVYDHILTVNGEEISLRDMCGRNTVVHFNYEYRLF